LIPEGVTSIEESAFEEAEELTSVTIPASVTSIGEMAFVWTYELVEFIVAPGNADFKSVDGVLFTKSGGTLLRYPMNKATPYIIPQDVTVIGNNAFTSVNLGSITIPSGVTSIGNEAFEGCRLTSLVIPANVTSIGEDAFAQNSLTSINIPEKVTTIGESAFEENLIAEYTVDARNTSFKSEGGVVFTKNGDTLLNYPVTKAGAYEVPPSVTIIGSGAFAAASALSSVSIPASVTTIGDNAFTGAGLTSVTFAPNSQLTSIGDSAFNYAGAITEISIPASVTLIGNFAFRNLSSLRTVTFAPNSQLTTIGYSVFGDATSLESITIPANVTTIGDFAFYGAASLTSLTFAANSQLTSIGSGAFANARSLSSVVIPATVVTIKESAFIQNEEVVNALTSITFAPNSQLTTIGDSAFRNVNALTNITIPANVKTIGEYAFANWNYNLFAPMALTTVTFEAGSQLERIERGAFQHQRSLSQITIPASVTSIGDNAFQWNRSLTSLSFESGSELRSIGSYAFENARLLTDVIFPANVTSIGEQAFGFALVLDSVTFESGSQLQSIGRAAFGSAGNLSTITIPAGVTSIGYGAFRNLNPDSTVYFLGNGPTNIDTNSFLQGVNAYVSNCATGFADDGSNWNGLLINVSESSNPCSVIYNLNGGFGLISEAIGNTGKVAEPADPERPGYAFMGWSDANGGSLITFPFTPGSSESNVTLYALWTANTYTVTYNSNGGTPVPNGSFTTGSQLDNAPANPTREGYSFRGWSTVLNEGDYEIEFPYDPAAISNITLYALWRANPGTQTPAPSASPTPTPSATPTTTPTPTPSATPTPSVSPTPSATSAPSPSASPKPTLTSDSTVQRSTTAVKTSNAAVYPKGSSKLSTAGKAALKKTVEKAGTEAKYTVTGAAGKSFGVPTRFVKALAASRAAKLKAYLLKLGVKESNIIVNVKITEFRVTPKQKIKVS
jgi:uncharacterized repeat protein (TIGR02543 family)